MSLLVIMSLPAPAAWGEFDGLTTWRNRLKMECAGHFGRKLSAWPGIARFNRIRVAWALCADDRIFWPYAIESQPQLAPLLEEEYNKPAERKPLVLGVIGPSARENSEVLHAVRDLLFLPSNTLFKWTGDVRALNAWRSYMEGGLVGGVITVDFDDSQPDPKLHVNRVRDAIWHMQVNEMDSYVLAIQSRLDVRDQFRDNPEIRWISLDSATSCEEHLR